MKTRYKIIIIILLIIGIIVTLIMMIDYVYANANTPQFTAIAKVFCPYFPISNDFVADTLFFPIYYTNPIIQLDMIHYHFQSVCYKETENVPIVLGPEYDPLNSKGCPQFCPKEDTTEKIDGMQEIVIDENKGGNDYGITTSYGFSYSEYPTTRNLDGVLQSCERWENARAVNFTSPDGTGFGMTHEGHVWYNSTHYIDSNICDFIPMKKHIEDSIIGSILEYCGSTHKLSYDNPYEYWFANETHYIDADTCLWQSLDDDDITLVLPDHWKIVYSND